MNRNLRISLYHFAVGLAALAVMLMQGCAPQGTVLRAQGYDQQWQGFRALPSERFGRAEAEIRVKVVVVEDMAAIGMPGAVGTYSHPEGIIHIVGKKINGAIITPPAVLGHEIQHALEYQGKGFVNPDRLDLYGY